MVQSYVVKLLYSIKILNFYIILIIIPSSKKQTVCSIDLNGFVTW